MIVTVRFARSANRCMNDNHMGRLVTTKRERNLAALEPVLQCIDSRVDARDEFGQCARRCEVQEAEAVGSQRPDQ